MDSNHSQDPQSGSPPTSHVGAKTPPPQVVYVQQPGGHAIFRWFSWLGWVGFLFACTVIIGMVSKYEDYFNTTGGIQEEFVSGSRTSDEKVAVIAVEGVISTGSFVKQQIDRVRDDDAVKAVVLRVNSPGGTITGSDYILHHLNELRAEREIPIVVSMGSIAASGGYYVSMVVGNEPNSIYAEPTTTTGSIGVIIPHYDVSGLLERYDVRDDSLVSHPRKQMLSMTRPISPEDRTVLEAYLQDAFTRFKEVVKSGRPVFRENEQQLDEIATGEIFTAVRAQEKGLVDELGFLEDAVTRSAEMAALSPDRYRVVRYSSPITLLGALTAQVQQPQLEFGKLFELGVPQAYYLATSLPPLLATWSRAAHFQP